MISPRRCFVRSVPTQHAGDTDRNVQERRLERRLKNIVFFDDDDDDDPERKTLKFFRRRSGTNVSEAHVVRSVPDRCDAAVIVVRNDATTTLRRRPP